MAEKKMDNNINLGVSTKKKFTVDGDRDRVIELDVHDIALVNRLSDSFKLMDDLKAEWEKLESIDPQDALDKETDDDSTLAEVTDFTEQFSVIENKMRDIIDFIFDSPGLCQTVLANSSIFSPVNGKYKFEQIIDVLTGLYEDNIDKEVKKLNKRTVEEKTSKYIRKTK